MINFSEILKNRRSEELPEPKNSEKVNDAFASLFAESVKSASDSLNNIAERAPQDISSEKNLIEAKENTFEKNENDKPNILTENEITKNKSEEIKALPVQKENNAVSPETADFKKTKTDTKKENKNVSKTDKENSPNDPIAETLKTANNILLSLVNKNIAAKPLENKTISSETMKAGAKAANVLTKNFHDKKSELNAGLTDKKLDDKHEKIISDFIKNRFINAKDKLKETPAKTENKKENNVTEIDIKLKDKTAAKTDHVKTVKAAESSATAEISKKNDINLNTKSGEEIQTVSNISSSGKKETSDGNFFSFDKNNSSIKHDREFKAEINTVSKTPFSDQLKDILNNSRINVRNDKNADITIKMNPENLGDMRVKMEMENGIIKANFTVATEEAKQLLLLNIEELKNSLSSGGISIGEMKVSVKSENGGENRSSVPDKNIVPDIKETTAVYSADSLYYDGQLNLVV